MSSRLAFDHHGRLVAIEADGTRWVVLGNLVYSTSSGEIILFGWLGRSGRPPTAREMAEARPPYESTSAMRERRQRLEVPDDELDEKAAIEAARLEQQRQPADLLQAVA